jgi:hypothetical protein
MSSICISSVDSNVVSEVDDRCSGTVVKGATSACVVRDRMVVINCGILSRAAADFWLTLLVRAIVECLKARFTLGVRAGKT